MGRKGAGPPGLRQGISSDVILEERRGQSQKPQQIYDLIHELVPNGISLVLSLVFHLHLLLFLVFFPPFFCAPALPSWRGWPQCGL